MEISTRHLVHSTPTVRVGWNQLKPDQSSCGAHDIKGNSVACHTLLLWTPTREVV